MFNILLKKITAFYYKFKDSLLIFLKSEGFKIGVIIFSCLFAICAIFPSFLDNSKLKFDITNRLSKLTQATFSIKGDVSISLLPVPAIHATNVFIENYALPNKRGEADKFYNIYAKNLKITFPLFKFNNKQLVSKITVDDCVIEIAQPEILKKIDNSLFNVLLANFSKNNPNNAEIVKDGLSSKFFSINDLESTAIFITTLPDIQISNSIITFFNEFGVSKEFKNVNSNIDFDDNEIEGYGTFNSHDIENEFKILAKFNSKKKRPDSYLSLTSSIFNLKIFGNFLENNLNGVFNTKFNGSMEVDIHELKSFYKTIISSSDLISEKLRENDKLIKLSSNIVNDGRNIEFKDITINSSVASGVGDFYINLSNQILTSDIKLDFENLDIDAIWSTDNPAKKIAEINNPKNNEESVVVKSSEAVASNQKGNSEQKLTFKSPLIKFKKRKVSDLILDVRDYDINLDVAIKNATLYEGRVKDVKLYGSIISDGKVTITPLSFKLPGNSEFRINGVLNNSDLSSRFSGHLDGQGESLYEVLRWLKIKPSNIRTDNLKKFNLYSDIEIDKNLFSLENLYINLDDKKTEFYGDIQINDLDKKRLVSADINISEFDIKKYILLSSNNSYFKEGILLDKLLWLNDIYSSYNLKFKFDKLIYDKNIFLNQDFVMNLGQGYLKIPKIKFNSEKNIFDFELSVDISDKNQLINLALNADKLKINFQREDFRESRNNYKNKNLFDNFFELPSLQGFSGQMSLVAKEIDLEDKVITDFDYKNSIKNSISGQTKITMKIYDGVFDYKGLCDIKYNKIINGNFSCKSCDLRLLLEDFYNVTAIEGIANISGNIVSIAKSTDEFRNNIDSEISIAISNPLIRGYGLNDLVKKMFSIREYSRELVEPEKIIENPLATTQYIQGKGFINLKGEKNSNFSINLNAPIINSIFSGIIFLNDETINGTLNTIFITGVNPKTTPINIATNVVGYFDDVVFVSNLNQARQYLGLERINSLDLNNKLLAKSEEVKISKKNNIQNNSRKRGGNLKKKINKKSLNSDSKETIEEENVTIENEIIEETQIIEVNKPSENKIENKIENKSSESQSSKSESKQTQSQANESSSSVDNKQKSSKLLPPTTQNSSESKTSSKIESENNNVVQPSP